MSIQMYDPRREYTKNKILFQTAINNVLEHGLFINGPEIGQLEDSLRHYVGVKECICVSSGTDALLVALLALGVSCGDEVITVAYSWISTVEVIALIGATPVFVDIDPETYNINPVVLEPAISNKTKAIIAVSLYGQMADFDEINKIASKHNIPVIEDGAQSFGATYKGKHSGSVSTIGTTSFFPSKPLGCYGDGGACFTNNSELGAKMRAIKNHGAEKRFHHKYVGLNARLDTIQAAVLNVKLSYFDQTVKRRTDCATYYSHSLQFLTTYGFTLPRIKEDRTSVWAQYSILAKNNDIRDHIVAHLKNNGINVSILYPASLQDQDCFQGLILPTELPCTNNACLRVFNLPCYDEFTKEEQDQIIGLLKSFVAHHTPQ